LSFIASLYSTSLGYYSWML